MQKLACFFGGPIDGEKHIVPAHAREWRVVEMENYISPLTITNAPTRPVPLKEHIYIELLGGNGVFMYKGHNLKNF